MPLGEALLETQGGPGVGWFLLGVLVRGSGLLLDL